ncbi:MAG: hypothetical protein M3Y65_15240 [Pseudomonadota bacterium]|nr:hypothetical protein [Pseudomonadota bacterium]
MVSAVPSPGAAALRAYSAAPAPAAGQARQARLERLQHQLSDNVHCASARTPEGKAVIAAIEDKIAAEKLSQQKETAPAAAPSTSPSISPSTSPVSRIGDTSGGVIDVYA